VRRSNMRAVIYARVSSKNTIIVKRK